MQRVPRPAPLSTPAGSRPSSRPIDYSQVDHEARERWKDDFIARNRRTNWRGRA